jgi:putative flippase GtrA
MTRIFWAIRTGPERAVMQRAELRDIAGELYRFCVVGGLNVLINNAIIVALTEWTGLHYLLSIIVCTIITTLIGFRLNRNWTFRRGGQMQWREFLRYGAGILANLALVMLLTWSLVQAGLPYYVACLIIAALMAPVNFMLHRLWSFGLRDTA